MVTNTPIYPQTITTPLVQILPADTTTLKTVYTAGTNGSKIERLLVSSTDTSNRDIAIYITVSGTDYLISTLQIPLNSGNTNAVPFVSVFDNAQFQFLAFDSNGNKYLYLANGAVLKAKSLTTVTTAKAITLFAQGGDY